MLAERLWYLATALTAWLYYADLDSCVLRRPSWASTEHLLFAARHHRKAVAFTVFQGILLGVSPTLVASVWARAAYAAGVAFCDLHHFAVYGGHTGFIFLYTAAAMVLPNGVDRTGVLRMIVAHQFGSSGLHKLRVGGLAWPHPSSMRATLQFLHDCPEPFKPHPVVEPRWLKQKWLIAFCLTNEWLLAFLGLGGLLFEMGVSFGCLFGGTTAMYIVAAACTSFHLATGPLMGITFPFSIQCYCIALLPAAAHVPPNLLSVPTMAAALLLGACTWRSSEDWPHNCMALFPWAAAQQEALYKFSGPTGKLMLAHQPNASPDRTQRTSSIRISEVASSFWPANYYPGYPEHERAKIGATMLAETENSILVEELVQWLRETRRFVDNRADGLRGRCFDNVVVNGSDE